MKVMRFMMHLVICVLAMTATASCDAADFQVWRLPSPPPSGTVDDDYRLPEDSRLLVQGAKEVVFYDTGSHKLYLTPEAAGRIRQSEPRWLVVCVDKKPIYFCRVWKEIYSAPSEGVVLIEHATGEFAIELGYPTKAYFKGVDRRADAAILSCFKERQKVRSKESKTE